VAQREWHNETRQRLGQRLGQRRGARTRSHWLVFRFSGLLESERQEPVLESERQEPVLDPHTRPRNTEHMEGEGKPGGPAPESLAAPSAPRESQLSVAQSVRQRVVDGKAVEELRSRAAGESDRLNKHAPRLYNAWLVFVWVGGVSAIAAAGTTALLPSPVNRWVGAVLALLASVCAFGTRMLPARKAAQAWEWAWGWDRLENDLRNFKSFFGDWPAADAWDEYESFCDRTGELYAREHAEMAEQDRARQIIDEHRGR
jgi:hypothetical protein